MITANNLVARAEQQKCTGTISTLGFAHRQTFVPHQSALLIANQPTDGNALQRTVGNVSVHL
jgi:hypothetical protein